MTVLTKPPGRVSFELGPAQTAQYPQPQKMGWWDSMFGPSPMATNPYAQPRPLPPTQPAPQTPASILAPAPAPTPSSAAPPTATPGTPGLPSSTGIGSGLHLPPPPPVLTPFPNTFASLPRHERKLWESMRKEELRAWKEWERGCKAAMKADEERKRREGKERIKRERVLEKQKQQEAKLAAKLGYRPLPQLSKPAPSAPTPTPAIASAPAPPTAPNPAFGSGPPPQWNPTTWAHLPPLEEFGVRRPFDAPGRPPVDIGATEWPKMSRTMTHGHEGIDGVKADGQASTEMSMEERIHMAQAGHTWSPATGWYRD